MKSSLAIREIVNSRGMKFTTLAAIVGIDRRVLDRRLHQENITVLKLGELAKALGYKVMLVPIEKNIPDAYEVE